MPRHKRIRQPVQLLPLPPVIPRRGPNDGTRIAHPPTNHNHGPLPERLRDPQPTQIRLRVHRLERPPPQLLARINILELTRPPLHPLPHSGQHLIPTHPRQLELHTQPLLPNHLPDDLIQALSIARTRIDRDADAVLGQVRQRGLERLEERGLERRAGGDEQLAGAGGAGSPGQFARGRDDHVRFRHVVADDDVDGVVRVVCREGGHGVPPVGGAA